MAQAELYVKNFGPITETKLSFQRYTFFIGPQGSGKSTLAKLYSLFTWLEKSLRRGMLTVKYVEQYSRFRNKYCAYHRLSSYFKKDTVIEFVGRAYRFTYDKQHLHIENLDTADTSVVKVMYIPAERTLLSSIKNLAGIKSLPESVQTFKEVYDEAMDASTTYRLPLGGTQLEFDRLNKIAWLKGPDYKVRLTDASSGFQAIAPMIVVTQYLTQLVTTQNEDKKSILTLKENERIRLEVRRIIDNPSLSPEVKQSALEALSARFSYSGLVNIVEEPEENLFPSSQQGVLYDLLALTQSHAGNHLVVTTHSPYIINYLTLALKAGALVSEGILPEAIDTVLPAESAVNADEVSIYQLCNGGAHLLAMPFGLPTDTNMLNDGLREANELFGTLIDLADND